MENDTKSLVFMLLLLVVIFAGIGWIISYNYININGGSLVSNGNEALTEVSNSNNVEFITVMREKEVSNNRVLINDRFIGDFVKSGEIVAISSDGDAYVVKSGTVLVDGMVVSSNDEDYSILRLDDYEKSVSSN